MERVYINKRKNSRGKISVNLILIIVNVAVFALSLLLIGVFGENNFLYWFAIQPKAFFSGIVWTLLTSMFMHGNFTHLFVNMLSLFFIGNFIEKIIGKKRFFWLYILSGIFAGFMFVVLSYFFGNSELGAKIFGSPEIFAVGASGAIFALGGLLVVLTPNLRVYAFFIIPMKIWSAMLFFLVFMWIASIGAGLPFGNTAHLGGLIAGLAYGLYLKKKYPRKTKMLSDYFS